MGILTGFKSTDIDTYSKVEPTTTTKFGYKRLGLDTNAMTGLYELASTTTETGTTDQVAIMSGVVGTVREGDILEYSNMRSEITSVSGSSFTLGRKISTLTSGLTVTIHRPTYLSTTSTGALNAASSATATLSNVAASASSVTLLAANSARNKAHFFNDSSYPCYLKHGSSASTTSFTVLMQPQSYYTIEPPCYSGLVAGIWGTASGTMRVTEETA